MELLVATAIGVLTAAGTYLVLRKRTFPVIIGLSLLTYAVNVFLFASGRLVVNRPPILADDHGGEEHDAAAAIAGAHGEAVAESHAELTAPAADAAHGAPGTDLAHAVEVAAAYTDPLPQALVLTAIVISFGMTAVIVIIALAAYLSGDDDRIDGIEPPEPDGSDAR